MKAKQVIEQAGQAQVRQIKDGEQFQFTSVIPIRIVRHRFIHPATKY
jgi:hypothetical protein